MRVVPDPLPQVRVWPRETRLHPISSYTIRSSVFLLLLCALGGSHCLLLLHGLIPAQLEGRIPSDDNFYNLQVITMEPVTLQELVKEIRIPMMLLEQKCSDDHLKSISTSTLFLDWQTVASTLGLSEIDIQEIKSEKTDVNKSFEVFQRWKLKYGFMANFKTLVTIFLKNHQAEHAESVCKLLQGMLT